MTLMARFLLEDTLSQYFCKGEWERERERAESRERG
jgi:hypothetical protein